MTINWNGLTVSVFVKYFYSFYLQRNFIKSFFTFASVFDLKEMEDKIHELVYSKTVIEFVTVANEYCNAIETVNKFPVEESLRKIQKILPLLYLKTTMLPKTENVLEDELEKYVSELDYNILQQKWLKVLGEHDSFYEVFDPTIQFGQETVTASVSENLMDIYQSLKDFLRRTVWETTR